MPGRAEGQRWRSALPGAFLCITVTRLTSPDIGIAMSQITARLPDSVVAALDAAARRLKRSRAEIVRQAVERYLEDFDDLLVAVDRLRDPNDPVLDWDRVRRELLDTD